MSGSQQPRATLSLSSREVEYCPLDSVQSGHVQRLPWSLKVLLENLLRHEDGLAVSRDDIEALANWDPAAKPSQEIAFTPSRVILQDFTGVPAVVDLAAMREAVVSLGGDAERINPMSPVELVIDHSVQVDDYSVDAVAKNIEKEYQRNQERYAFLRWGQGAFRNFRVVPPNTGIVHQVNLEYLARVVFEDEQGVAYPDTLVGTDSHTTMVNGLGVLGWGVGGIEAEAAMLGQPVTMLIPRVIGFRLTGELKEGTTATDLVLTVTNMLRERGVVDQFVEFFGDGLSALALADRATIANMSPEFGSTCAFFPIDRQTTRYLELTGRPAEQVELVEAYARAQGLWREDGDEQALYSDVLSLDLGEVEPSLAGPSRPQDRVSLGHARQRYREQVAGHIERRGGGELIVSDFESEGGDTAVGNAPADGVASVEMDGDSFDLRDGAVLIAAITSCTNTSNPAVLVAAGLLARNAAARGLRAKPWVKTSLAPGSRVVTDYLEKAGMMEAFADIGFYLVGYGCTTCIGNSGPLREEIATAVRDAEIIGCSVLSGNRNFEGRIHPQVRMNFLASPPLVVAYALAGTLDVDLTSEPLGLDSDGKPVFLRDLWPDSEEIQDTVAGSLDTSMFSDRYAHVFDGDENWKALPVPEGQTYDWQDASTYVRLPPFFEDMSGEAPGHTPISGARVLALLGDSVTTDHISPAGSIALDSPAARYLQDNGVEPHDFNSYGSRRGNHEVMMRGTFANIRLRNQLVPGVEGGMTQYLPEAEQMSIFDAAMRYAEDNTPLIVLAGAEYGTGSSRDWAAKGTLLLGVRAVIARSFERIHRSNLIGMGVLPLQFADGDEPASLGLDGTETYDIEGLEDAAATHVMVTATPEGGDPVTFEARVRIDTPMEREYYRHGGILHYVLRQLAGSS